MNTMKNGTAARQLSARQLETTHAAVSIKLGLVSVLVACGACTGQVAEPTSSGTPATAAPSVSSSSPTSARAEAATVSIQGTAQASDGSAIGGVGVCLRHDVMTAEGASCTTSDDSGAWKLPGAPTTAMVAISFTKTGFFPMLRAVATATSDITIPSGDGALIASSDASRMLGGATDPEGGHVAFSTSTSGAPGAAAPVTLRAAFTAGATDVAPMYLDASGKPISGATLGYSGVFANLTPGIYEVTFGGTWTACKSGGNIYGFPVTMYTPDGQARMLVPVVPGYLTTPVAANCWLVSSRN